LGCQNVKIMKIKILYPGVFVSIVIIVLLPKFANAAHNPDSQHYHSNLIAGQECFFEENKGQLCESTSEIKYYGHSKGVYFYCKKGMISFVFAKSEKGSEQISEATSRQVSNVGFEDIEPVNWKGNEKPSTITTARMDLVLVNSNPSACIIPAHQQKYFENFFTTGDADHGITNVHTYKSVTYKNIYPFIDMILKTADKGIEYSFLVHPGGDVSSIQLRWDGVEGERGTKNSAIKYFNSIGNIIEMSPKSFVEGKEIRTSIIRKGELKSFKLADYDKSKDLLIDPTLTWSTYYGGEFQEINVKISADLSGNIFLAGSTLSGLHLATSGAYQTAFLGSGVGLHKARIYDVFLAKFNSNDTLEWGTYYGGSMDDYFSDIKNDTKGDVYIGGSTYSANGIATSGAFQTLFSGGTGSEDPFLAKFTNSGSLAWATYFSGNGTGNGNALATDNSGNVIFTGMVYNTTGFVTSGAYQTSYYGNGCSFLASFTSLGKESWATYYGTGSTHENSLATDAAGNIYLAGDDGGGYGLASSGAYQTSSGGNYDALLTKFSSAGSRIWATYFGGNNQDVANAILIDGVGNIYLEGSTQSTTGLATSGSHQTFNGGGYDAFLAKFANSGKLSWSTYYGGTGDDQANGICMDVFGNIIITGNTSSSSGLGTSKGFQTSIGGGVDAFASVFNSSGNMKWATYFGGAGVENGNAICADATGNVFFGGITSTNIGLATSNVHQDSTYGFTDGFLVKFAYDLFKNDAGIDSINSPAGVVCAGIQPVNICLHNAGTTTISSVNIDWTINGTSQPTINFTDTISPGATSIAFLGDFNFIPGSNVIKVWTSKPNGQVDSFPFNDTIINSFNFNPVPLPINKTDSACYTKFVSIGTAALAGHRYKWTSPSGFTSNISDPNVQVVYNSLYILKETIAATGCSRIDSVNVKVNPSPKALWSVNSIGKTYNFYVKDSSLNKLSYGWTFGDSSATQTGYHVSHIFAQTKKYMIKLLVTNQYGCTAEDDSDINITAAGINSDAGSDLIDLNIYPNPFTYSTLLSFNLPQPSHVTISISDMKGKVLSIPTNETLNIGLNKFEINALKSGMSPGTYFIDIMVNDQLICKKVIEIK